MRKGDRKHMNQKPDLTYTSDVVSRRTKNYRRVAMSKQYWEDCGKPALDNELFKKCVFIGYGASAIRLLMIGLDSKTEDVHLTAEFMGYHEGSFEIVIKE